MSPTPQTEIPVPKDERRAMWRGAVEQELQSLVTEAAKIRKNITESKTSTKREYYTKKFKKCQAQVLQMVGTLQRLQSTEPPTEINRNDTLVTD